MEDFEKELKQSFLEEAKQAVMDVEQCFLALESNPADADNLNKIFRLAHNLKGSSKAVGFNEFGEFTHHFESFILKIKNGEIEATPSIVDLLLRANDHVRSMIEGLSQDLSAQFDSDSLLAEFQNPHEKQNEDQMENQTVVQNLHVVPVESSISTVALEENPPISTSQGNSLSNGGSSNSGPLNSPKSGAAPLDDTLRVSLSKIEHLINAVGELVILQGGLREQSNLLESMTLRKMVRQLNKVSKEIQETSMSLRMVPIKPVFQKMQRIVRDTSLALNKQINFLVEGENTDIDKTILERLGDPLVHLIRNSVDHGIEPIEDRIQKGKVPQGTVALRAFHQSGKLLIEISDDGGGLNPEKLKKKAIEKGLISKDTKMTDKEAQALIFLPGFSTKEQVTDVSGRGVGMDVVKTNIHEIGGEVEIESEVNKGSKFIIKLPLTLAIVDAMILAYGQEKFVIPVNQVYETLKLTPDAYQESSFGDILKLREENLPLFRMGEFFGLQAHQPKEEQIAIVIKMAGKSFALLVDDIIGQSQVVIKQLGPELQGMVGISGSTILGDGKPALILEAHELTNRKRTKVATVSPSSDSGRRASL